MLTIALSLQAPVEHLVRRAVQAGAGTVLIVPEQLSHETERRLCVLGGDSISLRAEVLSFTRLAQRVFSLYGGAARKRLDGAGRLLVMRQAVEELRSRMKFFASALGREQFLTELLQAVDELKSCRITPEQLAEAAGRLEGAQAQKLEELGLLLSTYNALCAAGAYDPKDALDRLADCLEESDYAESRRFFLGGFQDFTAQELRIVETLLRRGADVWISLCCDSPSNGNSSLETARRTLRRLRAMAGRMGIPMELLHEPHAFKPAQEFLLTHLYDGTDRTWEGEADCLTLVQAADSTEECRLAAEAVRQLLRQGVHSRDVAVALCSVPEQLPILRRCLAAMEIPFYCVGRADSGERPLFALVRSALDCVSYGFRRTEVIACLRTGLYGFTQDEADLLENYALAWNIRGSRWMAPFTAHPDGYDGKMNESAKARLEALNALRERAIAPLQQLQEQLRAAAALPDQVLALYDFLETLSLPEQMARSVTALQAAGRLQRANEEAQLYSALIAALEQLHAQSGTAKPLEGFYRLVEMLLNQYDVATIPPVLDSVTVGGLEELRGRSFDTIFLLGAADGAFPAYQRSTSLIGEEERFALRQIGLDLPGTEERLDRGSAAVFSVLSAARERLWISAARDSQPSYLFARFCRQFPRCVRQGSGELPPAGLRELAARTIRIGSVPTLPEAQAAALDQDRAALERQIAYQPERLSPEAVTAIYGRTLSLSPSKLDRLGQCRFGYYLEYGLQIQERRAYGFDAPIFGTFVHAVLEETVRQVEEQGGFALVSDETIRALADESIARFARTHFQGTEGERFTYLFARNRQEVLDILDSLSREMRRSDFHAKAFELRFAPDGPLPPIPIEGASLPARIVGVVDRADLARVDGHDYLRIVDYKTGKKELDYTDLAIGESLQMLIYLSALRRLGLPGQPATLYPAGVLYFPARERILPASRRLSADEAEKLRRKESRRSGLILDDEAVLQAMEHGEPEYLPYKESKSGRKGDLADPDQWALLDRHVQRVLRARVEELASGDTEPNPYVRGQYGSCTWCPYADVCRFQGEERRYKKTKSQDFWNRLRKEDSDGEL